MQIIINTNTGRKTVIANEEDTVRKVLADNHVNYGMTTVMLNGDVVRDVDATLEELGAKNLSTISCCYKADNAVQVKTAGQAMVIVSGIKTEDLKKAEKFRPEALVLKDKDDEPVFAVATGKKSSIEYNSITFGEEENGFAAATIYPVEREKIKEDYAFILISLKKVEAQLEAAMTEIAEDAAAVEAMIV